MGVFVQHTSAVLSAGDLPCLPRACSRAKGCSRQRFCVVVRSARHSDFQEKGFGIKHTSNPDGVYDVEADERYRRADMAAVHAYEARKTFVDCIRYGEAHVDLAEAALAISAEDDALVTHSTVAFPSDSYRQRIKKLAKECDRMAVQPLPSSATKQEIIAAIETFIFDTRGYSLPSYGRSNMPEASIVDHAGVWEDSRLAYLNELLIRRVGSPAALTILSYDVMRQLFLSKSIDFAVRIDCRSFEQKPTAEALPLPRSMISLEGGRMLNTCSTDALVEVLRHLKRSFWPFAWNTSLDDITGHFGVGSQGGFRSAASEAIEGPVNARIQVIAKAASNRLERGVWTSPGAGDIRRSLAACERLVLLADADSPWERRDLGVLYMFRGMPERAKSELLAYSETEHARNADLVDQRYVGGLLEVLRDVVVQKDDAPLSVDFYLELAPPDLTKTKPLPLTW